MPPTPTQPNLPKMLVPDPSSMSLIPAMTPENATDGRTFAGLRVVRATELQHDAFCLLGYGQGGVGKTTLAGMFADYGPARDVLVVDGEGGATAISNKAHIDVIQASKWREVEAILKQLERSSPSDIPYRTVVFDNLSEYQTMQLASIVGEQLTGVEIQHWGQNTAAIMRVARRIRDLSRFKGINTVMLAWQYSGEDDVTKKVRHGVALTNKLAARLPGIVNVVGYLSIVDNPPLYTRRLSFAASPRTDAKFRRASGDKASAIPLEIYYGIEQNPIVDILRTLYEGVPFPTKQYEKPTGKATAATARNESESATDTAGA